jgi:hypothetical protein
MDKSTSRWEREPVMGKLVVGAWQGVSRDGDVAIVWTDASTDNWGYIDRTGRIIWQSNP